MLDKFQQLYEDIMGAAAVPGSSAATLGTPVDFNDESKADTRTSMAITGKTSVTGSKKNKKSKFPIIKRPPIRTGGL